MMQDFISQVQQYPISLQVGLVLLLVLAITLDIWALSDLARRSEVMWGRKWLWVLIILLVSNGGAILYLVMGRHVHKEAPDPQRTSGGPEPQTDKIKKAVDLLYGPDNKQ